MLYQNRTFTCPTSHNTTEQQWDLSFLSKDEFMAKYKLTPDQYDSLAKGATE